MSNLVYLSGELVVYEDAKIHVEDRGFQFADSVYEVMAVYQSQVVDREVHYARLERSLMELEIAAPMPRSELDSIVHDLIQRNGMESGNIYIQISRGVAPRHHSFPEPAPKPTVVIMTKPCVFPYPEEVAYRAEKVITLPDIRWGRRDIKSVNLLANCMAMTEAERAGAYDAILFEPDGSVTEASASSAWIVTHDGEVLTRALSNQILPGTCRGTTLKIAQAEGMKIREQTFSVDQMKSAAEVFLSGTTPMINPVGQVDDVVIGDGHCGPITRRLLALFRERVFSLNS